MKKKFSPRDGRRVLRMVVSIPVATGSVVGLQSCASASRFESGLLERLAREGVPGPDHQQDWSSPAGDGTATLPATGPISLADLLGVARHGNPELAAARSEIGAAAARAWQATLYPNPRVEVGAEEVPFRAGISDGITTASVTQPIVLGDRLHAAEDAANAETAIRRARADLRLQEVFGEIAVLHARVLATRKSDSLYEELSVLGGQTLETARLRYEARAAPETEVTRPQIELYRIDLAQSRLRKEREAAVGQLVILLGGAGLDESRLVGEITDVPEPISLQELTAFLRSGHPAIAVADREIQLAEAQLQHLRSERVPDLDVRVGAGYDGDREDGIYEVGAGMTVPLWDNRDGDLLAARFELMRARQHRLAVENELLGRLAAVHGEYEVARVQLATARESILPAAQRSFDQTQESYRGGRAAFLDLLDAQRSLVEARVMVADLSAEAAIARARLLQIAGPDSMPRPSNVFEPDRSDVVSRLTPPIDH